MNDTKNIILTGELHCGKSTLVRQVLKDSAFDYKGIFSQAVFADNETVGYGLLVADQELQVFAHTDFDKQNRFGKYGLDLQVFENVVDFIKSCLQKPPRLFVVDEVGIFENDVRAYKNALIALLDSAIPCLFVVQKRAVFMHEIQKRSDVFLYALNNDHIRIEREIKNHLVRLM